MKQREVESQMNKNRICELLGISYPIIQAPMNWVSGADLAAAVSAAGGLGTIGPNAGVKTITPDVTQTGERLRSQIKKVKSLTDKPFAVNITIGIAGDIGREYSRKCVDVVLEEGVPVVIGSVGSPDVYTSELQEAGIKVLHAISTAKHAKKAESVGVDAVICEGFEAGGHKGLTELTTFVLVPMVADAVEIPVVAGGGIADARGALAAMVLGADGIYMGTRFIATNEADAHHNIKEAVAKAEDVCTVSIPKAVMLSRVLRNSFAEQYLKMKEAGTSSQELNEFLEEHASNQAFVQGDVNNSEIYCGQAAGLVKGVESAAEVIQNITSQMILRFEEMKSRLMNFQ